MKTPHYSFPGSDVHLLFSYENEAKGLARMRSASGETWQSINDLREWLDDCYPHRDRGASEPERSPTRFAVRDRVSIDSTTTPEPLVGIITEIRIGDAYEFYTVSWVHCGQGYSATFNAFRLSLVGGA